MNDAAPNTCSIGVADMSTLPSRSLESQTSHNEIKYYTTNYIDYTLSSSSSDEVRQVIKITLS